jgi:hypothetical protein
MQMRQDCFIDKCKEKASSRKGKNVKVGKYPTRLRVLFCRSGTDEN